MLLRKEENLSAVHNENPRFLSDFQIVADSMIQNIHGIRFVKEMI